MLIFDEFRLDPTGFELRRGDDLVDLEPQVFEVLRYLVEHADRVVTKTELLDEVWETRFVSESTLTSRIKTARKALGDDGRAQRFIKTVHGRGYRFVGDVTSRGDAGIDRAEPAPEPGVAAAGPTNLPAERTALFGRDADITDVCGLVDEHRLVSLLGIGGTGKTRLAIAAARSVAARFPDGVCFVDLVPILDARGIALALAEAADLGLRSDDQPVGQVAALVRDRRMLFVVDNAEHVVDACADVLDELLEATVAPRFVVTSRVPLGLPDERRRTVDPLDVAATDRTPPSVALLHAAAHRYGATVDIADSALVRIAEQLDGLPLALELAAAQLRHLDATSLAERLDRRFEVLEDRRRRGRERHASLHAVLSDTWDLLEEDDRHLLATMAGFPAGFSLDDLAGVIPGAAVESGMGELVDRSLVAWEPASEGRYRLLETVRLFARRQAGVHELAEVDDRHAAWCVEQLHAHDPEPGLFSFRVSDWWHDHPDDVRAAAVHLNASDRPDEAAALLGSSALAMHGDTGARAADVLGRIVQQLDRTDDAAVTARLHQTGVMCGMATRSPEVIAGHGRLGVEAAEASGDPLLRSASLVLLSWSTVFADPAVAVDQTGRGAELGREAGSPHATDFALAYQAWHVAMQRRYDDAAALAQGVADRRDRSDLSGHPTLVAMVALAVLRCFDDPELARSLIGEVLDLESSRSAMWSNELVEAVALAAGGPVDAAVAATERILARLARTGQDAYPDLLLPVAALAHRVGDQRRTASLLASIRGAGRPTQNFQATLLYRRLRELAGDADERDLDDRPVEVIGAAAMAWMREHA
ncbi:MAG: winged helix-turn-helix domain-containing protein [Actinomycetota bacterium]